MSTASSFNSIDMMDPCINNDANVELCQQNFSSRILCVYLLELQSSISFFICTWNILKASFKGPVLPGECEFVSLIDVSLYDFINVKDWECNSLKPTQKRDSSKIPANWTANSNPPCPTPVDFAKAKKHDTLISCTHIHFILRRRRQAEQEEHSQTSCIARLLSIASWWFQTIWRRLVKLDHFRK